MSNRRVAQSHSLLPDFRLLFAVLLTSAVAVVAAYTFLDKMYMEWFLAGNVNKSGIFALTTDLGKSSWILISTGSILLFMTVYKFPRLSACHAVHWHHIFLKFYFAFTTIAFSGLLVILFKNVIGRARPVFHDSVDLWASSPFADPYLFASFPSGHSTTIAALASVIFLLAPRLAIIAIPMALWVGISRIAVGAHFPSDVAAGLCFGAIFTWLYARSFAHKRLLFEFDAKGQLRLRNLSAKRARQKIRKRRQSLAVLGFGPAGQTTNW